MNVNILFVIFLVNLVLAQESTVGVVVDHNNRVEITDCLNDTDLVLVFVIFRHGDRTPDQEELDKYPAADTGNKNIFFPYGKKALTNKGKQRGFLVGEYLRSQYDGFISRLYLPDEVDIRTTEYARTKMTALTALAALYPPPPAQRWNPMLDWQPVPYDTVPFDQDDLLYWYICPRYDWLRRKVYELPESKKKIMQYSEVFQELSERTGQNISTTDDVFYLDNLFQTLNNVGIKPPQWAQKLMPQIQDITKLEYSFEFYTDEMIRLATGVLMSDIVNATNNAILGNLDQPKLRLYSAHENNVAALMAAARVFKPHQPRYGATFSLELRRRRDNGKFGIAAVYSPEAGGPSSVIPIRGCGGRSLCDYDTFLTLTHDTVWSYQDFRRHCTLTD